MNASLVLKNPVEFTENSISHFTTLVVACGFPPHSFMSSSCFRVFFFKNSNLLLVSVTVADQGQASYP